MRTANVFTDAPHAAQPELTREQIRRAQFIEALHAFAEFLEQHPTLPTPSGLSANVFVQTRDQVVEAARLAGVSWEKHGEGSHFFLRQGFGVQQDAGKAWAHWLVAYDLNVDREQVCRKVVTGTRIEPAVPAMPEREVDTFTWVCDEPLLGAKEER